MQIGQIFRGGLFGQHFNHMGGGITNWSFLQDDLIDELSLVIAPVADGSADSASIFEQAAFLPVRPPQAFTLIEVKVLDGDTLWLRYHLRH